MRALIVLAVLLSGCSAFSAPGKLVEYHNRATFDYQVEKWSMNPARGGGVALPRPSAVNDNR